MTYKDKASYGSSPPYSSSKYMSLNTLIHTPENSILIELTEIEIRLAIARAIQAVTTPSTHPHPHT